MGLWKIKGELKPMLVLFSTMIFFPLGYFFCAIYYRMNMTVSIFMSLLLIGIGFILVSDVEDTIYVYFILNVLSAVFVLSYLVPLSEIRFIEKRKNKLLFQKVFVTIIRIFTLFFLLIPAAIVPLNMMAMEGKNIQVTFQREGDVFNLSYFEAEVIVCLTVVWFILAIYSYFKPSSYFLDE